MFCLVVIFHLYKKLCFPFVFSEPKFVERTEKLPGMQAVSNVQSKLVVRKMHSVTAPLKMSLFS